MSNKGMYRFEVEAFYAGTGSEKPKLSHSDFANDSDFEDKTDTSEVVDFLMCNDRHYDPDMTKLKSGSVKTTSKNANKLFLDVYTEFEKKLDSVELFSCIIDFYGLDAKEYFSQLKVEHRMKLIKDMNDRCDLGWHSRRHGVDVGLDDIEQQK